MAKAHYVKLLDKDIIPLNQHAACNFLNQYVSIHDGYKVLYSMIKDYHLLLKKNAILAQPNSASCNNLYEYSTKFYSYLLFEQLAGHQYSAHQQVLMFIGALDNEYKHAVAQVYQLLKTWINDDYVLPNTTLEELLSTIDQCICRIMPQIAPYIHIAHA